MRSLSFAIGLTFLAVGSSSAQAAVEHNPADHHRHSQAALSVLPRGSPAALRRCALPHKILNAASRSACKGHPRASG
jgi:hypothetical protein